MTCRRCPRAYVTVLPLDIVRRVARCEYCGGPLDVARPGSPDLSLGRGAGTAASTRGPPDAADEPATPGA